MAYRQRNTIQSKIRSNLFENIAFLIQREAERLSDQAFMPPMSQSGAMTAISSSIMPPSRSTTSGSMTSPPATLSRVDLGIFNSIKEVLNNIRVDIESLVAKEIETASAAYEETKTARKALSLRLQVEQGIL